MNFSRVGWVVGQLLLWGFLKAGLNTVREAWLHQQPVSHRNETSPGRHYDNAELQRLQQRVLDMFYHGYESYMKHAFPHDDLKPLTFSYTDSLGELGTDGSHKVSDEYQGVAMTLIDTMSTLAVLGNASEFQKNVNWLTNNLSFDVDVRVNVFEANIRLLGGLLSAHLLAVDPEMGPRLMSGGYDGGLLDLAYSLALRLLPAFLESPTGLPYAWINLRHGMNGSRLITETNLAACGSLVLEMATLSRLTGNPVFEEAAIRALERVWLMRSPRNLLGSSLNMVTGEWRDPNGGIGASSDSFYEYLLKAYILFGEDPYWLVFEEAYKAALQHYKLGAWYHDADVLTGNPTHMQFTALQAFWPGLQVLAGDVLQAIDTFENFMAVWLKFGVLPERYLFASNQLHPTEQYYPLRPELIESNTYLHQATGDSRYLANGEVFMDSLYKHSWTPGGWASVRSVATHEQEDHMHSFFLAETCKYLFLLYNDTFLREGNYVFTTEGHPMPVSALSQRRQQHPPHQQQPPGNATLATLHTHPFYRQQASLRSFPEAAAGLTWTHTLVMEASLGTTGVGGECNRGPDAPQDGASYQLSGLEAAEQHMSCSTPHREARPSRVQDTELREAPVEAGEQQHCSRWQQPQDWGYTWSNSSALDARVCPFYSHVQVRSLCHMLDRFADHQCTVAEDCGTDAGTCRPRVCTQHGFCASVVTLTQAVPNLAAVLLGSRSLKEAGVTVEQAQAQAQPHAAGEEAA